MSPRPPAPPSTAAAGPLSFAIFSLARAHRGYAAQLLRDLGLHPGQELLLMQLLERDGQAQSELLAAVGLDHSTVSKSLRRMQEAGLVTRTAAEHDRRVLVVSLTDAGRALRPALTAMWAELERVSTRDLDPAAAAAFIATAAAVQRSVEERDQQPTPAHQEEVHS